MFAPTPPPPYYAVIFSSTRTEGDDGYEAMAERILSLAARQPGYLGAESVRNAAPLPPLSPALARRGRAGVVETWLFRGDGRFQLRSLSTSPQRSE